MTDDHDGAGPALPDPDVRTDDAPATQPDLSVPVRGPAGNPPPAREAAPRPIDAERRIARIVDAFVDEIATLDVHGEEYSRRVDEIDALADREINTTSEMSSRLLERPVQIAEGMLEGRSPLGRKLAELRDAVDELNPSRFDLSAPRPRRVLGLFPAHDPLRTYFDRQSKARRHIEGMVAALSDSQAELEHDNAALEQEERGLQAEMESLREYAYLADRLDRLLEARIAGIERTDRARGRVLREDVLYAVRRRRQEILTHLAVAEQGYAALRIVEQNNDEVIRAIRSATTTTVAALRTAVLVAETVTSRRRLTERLRAANDVATARTEDRPMLGGETGVAALQVAWDTVLAALDQLDNDKLRALESVKLTASELAREVERAGANIERPEPRATFTTAAESALRLDRG